MLVHRCDRCCVYKKEIQPCRTKYRGIWAILMHNMMFPSESCNSANSVRFLLSRTFSPRVPPEPLHVPLGVCVPQFGNRWSRGAEGAEGAGRGEGGETRRRGR